MIAHARRHTIALARLLRRYPLRNRKRLPRQRQPDLIRMEYYKALLPHIQVAQRAFAHNRAEIMRVISENTRQDGIRLDEKGPHRDYLRRLVADSAAKTADAFKPEDVTSIAMRFGQRTDDFSKQELNKQVVAAMGVPLSSLERPAVAKLPEFAKENVDLIKTVPERYFDRIERDVLKAYDEGMTAEDLADQLVNDYGAAESDALRIARDQIGKLNAELNEARVSAMGITEYIWRTMNDERVRDEHQALEGERFSYDEGNEDGDNPGEAIQCRCYAEPAFDQVLGEED